MINISFTVGDFDMEKLAPMLKAPGVFNVSIKQLKYKRDDELLMYSILELICLNKDVSPFSVLFNSSRDPEVVEVQQIFSYIITEMFPEWHHRKIAKFIDKDRTVVIYGKKKIDEKINKGRVQDIPENKRLKIEILNMKSDIKASSQIQHLITKIKR